MHHISKVFILWVALSVVICGLFVFAYWGIQQEYRMSLNDPQIQMVEDAGAALAGGAKPAEVIPQGTIDIKNSLAPWLAVYTATGTPLGSSGELNGVPPKFPPGVFDTTTWHTHAEMGLAMPVPPDEDRFSWQPESDVRQAVVLVHTVNGDFVAAGRNMREVENREGVLTEGAALACGATELGTLIILTLANVVGWL